MSDNSDCIFCRIAKKEIPSETVYEDKDTLAFLDTAPRAPGHTVVISREHKPTILELSENAMNALFKTVKGTTASVAAALGPQGFTIGINHGRVSGQEVEHLHVHVLPRFTGDGGDCIQSLVHNIPKEPLSVLANKIRAASRI